MERGEKNENEQKMCSLSYEGKKDVHLTMNVYK